MPKSGDRGTDPAARDGDTRSVQTSPSRGAFDATRLRHAASRPLAQPAEDLGAGREHDPLAPARGLVVGLIAGAVAWAAIGLTIWLLVR